MLDTLCASVHIAITLLLQPIISVILILPGVPVVCTPESKPGLALVVGTDDARTRCDGLRKKSRVSGGEWRGEGLIN